MCKLFSFSIDRSGKVYALLGKDRAEALLKDENPDSHTYISKVFGIDEDQTWKYEVPIDIAEIEKAVEDGSIKDLSLRRLKYDGGLPEEELKASHENAMRSFLDELDWKKNVLEPMKNPMAFIHKNLQKVIDFINSDEEGHASFLLSLDDIKLLFRAMGASWNMHINWEENEEFYNGGQCKQIVHHTDLIKQNGKGIINISKRKYWNRIESEVKMKRVFILSGFEDLTEEEA